jgi:hypothetical protein
MRKMLLLASVCVSLSLSAMHDGRQDHDMKKVNEFLFHEIQDPRFKTYERGIPFLNNDWAYHHGFKAIAAWELAISIVNGNNTVSKDENPFDSTGWYPGTKGAKWCNFCTERWHLFSENKLSEQETIDFLVLCGRPMEVAIEQMHQTPYYRGFLDKVVEAKLELQKRIHQE